MPDKEKEKAQLVDDIEKVLDDYAHVGVAEIVGVLTLVATNVSMQAISMDLNAQTEAAEHEAQSDSPQHNARRPYPH